MRYESDYTNYSDKELIQELNDLMGHIDWLYYETTDPFEKENYRRWYALLQESSYRVDLSSYQMVAGEL